MYYQFMTQLQIMEAYLYSVVIKRSVLSGSDIQQFTVHICFPAWHSRSPSIQKKLVITVLVEEKLECSSSSSSSCLQAADTIVHSCKQKIVESKLKVQGSSVKRRKSMLLDSLHMHLRVRKTTVYLTVDMIQHDRKSERDGYLQNLYKGGIYSVLAQLRASIVVFFFFCFSSVATLCTQKNTLLWSSHASSQSLLSRSKNKINSFLGLIMLGWVGLL